ncbi:hypothetical protein V2V61_11080 [Streptococcus agalactiae]
MTTLLEDWCAYCQGEVSFDKSHFIGLLKDHSSEQDLAVIMSYLPHSDALLRIARVVISNGNLSAYLLPKFVAEQQLLKEMGWRWLREMERTSTILGDDEIAGICRNASVEFVCDDDLESALSKDNPNAWFFDLVSDSVLENLVSDSDIVYALLEAFYGLSADYFIAWYMAAPLINIDLNLSAYFDLWRNGGRCVLAEDALYVNQRSL